ncbi:hypothetical protein N8T08_005540 [Aspergillus melleus]|uniref:Uncharacterized protein n=1 Tax=Aspergillus melleus TaxID=138277 RepID=A0ACC3B1Z5_9EURO|nr:hypothetical protein N8T08_005540 [Aspergillus melleus]
MDAPKPQTLTGKIAIVTGASRGIGAGIALDLAERGARVAITYTSNSSTPLATTLVNQINSLPNHITTSPTPTPQPIAIAIQADLTIPTSAAHIITTTLSSFHSSTIDILINNAAVSTPSPLPSITPTTYGETFNLNVLAPILLTQAILPYLPCSSKKQKQEAETAKNNPEALQRQEEKKSTGGGRVINISSVASRSGFTNLSLYSASKSALEGLTRCWATELGAAGHTVNAVNLGPVQTSMLDGIDRGLVSRQIEDTPVDGGRIGEIGDVTPVVGWLCAEENPKLLPPHLATAPSRDQSNRPVQSQQQELPHHRWRPRDRIRLRKSHRPTRRRYRRGHAIAGGRLGLNVNVLGTYWTVKLLAEHLVGSNHPGSIVTISSMNGQGLYVPVQPQSAYNASKAAIKGLGAPLQRLGVPDDLTPMVCYLLSDAASFTTGADMLVTGGLHAGSVRK